MYLDYNSTPIMAENTTTTSSFQPPVGTVTGNGNGNGTTHDGNSLLDDMNHKKPIPTTTNAAAAAVDDAQSAYGASTLMADAEKHRPSGQVASGQKRPGNLLGTAIETNLTTTTTTKGLDPVYAAKAQLLNEALLDIGMGRYQWFLVVLTSVGWFLDEVREYIYSSPIFPPSSLPS